MRLVPRFVEQGLSGKYHLCAAREEFEDGAIVTLQALCGAWCFGRVTLLREQELRTLPETVIC